MKITRTTILALMMTAFGQVWGGFDEGLTAYNAEEYATALLEWMPLAEEGDAKAQFRIGRMYLGGDGVPKNHKEAARWFRKAAEQGDAEAQYQLGFLYYIDIFQGVYDHAISQDYAEAMKWCRKAAKHGHAGAQSMIGSMYKHGSGVIQDYAQAIKWFRKAAEQGNTAAQLNLGSMYDLGQGVPQDYVQAHKWFNIAAAAGRVEGARGRDIVAEKMTASQVADAQRLATEWVEKHQ